MSLADKMSVIEEITAINLDYRRLAAKYQCSSSQIANIIASKEKKSAIVLGERLSKFKKCLVMWKWKVFNQ